MRKLILILLVLSVFTACSNKQNDSKETSTGNIIQQTEKPQQTKAPQSTADTGKDTVPKSTPQVTSGNGNDTAGNTKNTNSTNNSTSTNTNTNTNTNNTTNPSNNSTSGGNAGNTGNGTVAKSDEEKAIDIVRNELAKRKLDNGKLFTEVYKDFTVKTDGVDDKGRYIIAVRGSNTEVIYWFTVDVKTGKFEIEG